MVLGQGSQQGVVQKPLGSRGVFKYQVGSGGSHAAPGQPGWGSAPRWSGDGGARLGTGEHDRPHGYCGAARPRGRRWGRGPTEREPPPFCCTVTIEREILHLALTPPPPTAPSPRPPFALIGFLPVIVLVGVPVVAVLVLLGEVSLGAQGREREQPGAGADGGEGRRLQPHGQRSQRQSERLELRQLVSLKLLL